MGGQCAVHLPCPTLGGTPLHGTTWASASPSPLGLSASLGAPGRASTVCCRPCLGRSPLIPGVSSTVPGTVSLCSAGTPPPHRAATAHGTSGQRAQNTPGEVAVFSGSRPADCGPLFHRKAEGFQYPPPLGASAQLSVRRPQTRAQGQGETSECE
ncbi:hypothetical protein HJG60_008431 [Phyllostomus discolor]|uniref:Uncharacterized protein n=1 Tax=Phyllostomus discolor TaxID=89673 RepID=A0A833Z8E9_9CHIR|nr:hypothetical protein HJG60_008431 [Phyllostomus discolor]